MYSVKKSSEITPMETPIDASIVDVVMEPMETWSAIKKSIEIANKFLPLTNFILNFTQK